ncbi:PQQ-dependent sugar dehydrogenase [Hymenobacter cellulosilyticus]|uniref:PQQ-dependent sugar dehydrogenase n=1 Tax=Hymenobacter cellulosilyticus TaxID=2932248 RepID=A0A8T9QA83_9BACT|nr:PQQ-dependent sugar dehydrogenase [Hymenobacter cellulosilyticus]UOQ71813.1 PQQ-dependent sugar dehydrogenase [Hymenobacter cellulosilyticus]
MRLRFLLLGSLGALLHLSAAAQTVVTGPRGERFAQRVVAQQLSDPWAVVYGPDNFLWVTEARGYRVSRINPATGARQVVLDLSKERQFPRYDKIPDQQDGGKPWPQGGLMGLALHPQLLSGQPYVYLAYLYRFAGAQQPGKGSKPKYGGNFFTTRLVRYQYDATTQTLDRPEIMCDTIPGSNDHNGGRLLVAPFGSQSYLFYGIGDLGAGQFDNGGRPNHAQQPTAYEGKVLRFNLAPDADLNSADQWIPNDNPFNQQRQNAVWTTGHRNPQGLAYAVVGGVGRLYSSEHGPYSDDEINLLEKGKNYGHPLVIGLADGNYDGLAAGASDHEQLPGRWHTTYPTIGSEKANAAAIGPNYRDPLYSLYPLSNQFLTTVLTRTRAHSPNEPTWNSEAPSSLAVYTAAAIPGWQNSLLIPALKKGKLIRLKLTDNGARIGSDTLMYFRGPVRYRDVALSPDGRRLYLATDSTSITSGPSEEAPKGNTYKGCVLELTYLDGGSAETPVAANRPTPEQALREATALVQKLKPQDRQVKRAGLPAAQQPIFDLLLKPTLTAQEKTRAQRNAAELLRALRQQ